MIQVLQDFFGCLSRGSRDCTQYWDPNTRWIFDQNVEKLLENKEQYLNWKIIRTYIANNIRIVLVEFYISNIDLIDKQFDTKKQQKIFGIVRFNNKHYLTYLTCFLYELIDHSGLRKIKCGNLCLYTDNQDHSDQELVALLKKQVKRILAFKSILEIGIPSIRVYWLKPIHPVKKLVARSMFVEPMNGYVYVFHNMINTNHFTHELIHSIYYQTFKTWPPMLLREGIAEALFDDEYYIEFLEEHDVLNLNVLGYETLDRDTKESAAKLIGMFNKYLIEIYGADLYHLAYRSIETDINIILIKVYSITLTEFKRNFIFWIKKRFSISIVELGSDRYGLCTHCK